MANSPQAAMSGVEITLQDAATTGNGIVVAVPQSIKEHLFTIKGSSGVGAGAIQVEAANAYDYSGTWAAQGGAPTTVQADKELTIGLSGTFMFLRARISTTVSGGTVTVTYYGS